VCGFGVRVFGRGRAPRAGGALICANHQSTFDPIIVGLSLDVRLNYLAKKNLFETPGLKQLIEYLDAIAIDRDGSGLAGLKETLKRLKRDEQVVIFPEGTRTRDGEVAPLKPGFVTLARRGQVPLVPVGIDGAYQAWPRTRSFPGLSQVVVVIGEPISRAQVEQLADEELVAELERRIRQCHAQARRYRLSSDWPRPLDPCPPTRAAGRLERQNGEAARSTRSAGRSEARLAAATATES
jgi:1-acyl-sn-glycerol-3-phosphate acyltransferase